jgi:ubiquinone/menaquinone biosynthesis C-methylase UbiE
MVDCLDKPSFAARALSIEPVCQRFEMLELSRRNAAGRTNAEFHQGTIDNMPLPDNSVDCVISNCVINLAPDEPAVFGEITRILKPS